MLTKCIPYRPNDYMYDPLFAVSGPTDHYKAAITSQMSSIKYQICPVFNNFFSDLPNHPRIQLVERRQQSIQFLPYIQKSSRKTAKKKNIVDATGTDRSKFFYHIINLPPKDFEGINKNPIRFTFDPIPELYSGEDSTTGLQVKAGNLSGTRSIQVQTIYRESETQTIPWEPPYAVIGEGTPEVLLLKYLKWDDGLPAGVHELKLIERARMKRAWQNTIKPNANDPDSLMKYRDYVQALECDEWAFREMEIQEIQEIRLFLLEQMLEDIHYKCHKRGQSKLEKFIEKKELEKNEKLKKLKHKTARELRKLELPRKGYIPKYHKTNIIEEHISKKSELYAPLMRHGQHPKRSHFIVDETMKDYKEQFIDVEHFNTLPQWLNEALTGKTTNFKKDESQLCIRETKWTSAVLKQLHEELMNISRPKIDRKITCRRLKNVDDVEAVEIVQAAEKISLEEEQDYQNSVFLQNLIRGRAVQTLIHEGRNNCKELIEEVRNSIGLLKKEKSTKAAQKSTVRKQQREATNESVTASRLKSTLGQLQGDAVGALLDFLSKELQRLLEERKAHAMCWINERERNLREAAEADRRQNEIRRQKEHDKIFKQIVKTTQESIDVYLRDIITEGMNFTSNEEAEKYIKSVAKRLDEEVEDIDKTFTMQINEEELISDLLHHHVLPEIDKQAARNRQKTKQKECASMIFDTVHSKFDNIFKQEFDNDENNFDFNSIAKPVTEKFKSSDNDASMKQIETQLNRVDPNLLEKYLHMVAQEKSLISSEQSLPIVKEKFPTTETNKQFFSDLTTISETEQESSIDLNVNSAKKKFNNRI